MAAVGTNQFDWKNIPIATDVPFGRILILRVFAIAYLSAEGMEVTSMLLPRWSLLQDELRRETDV